MQSKCVPPPPPLGEQAALHGKSGRHSTRHQQHQVPCCLCACKKQHTQSRHRYALLQHPHLLVPASPLGLSPPKAQPSAARIHVIAAQHTRFDKPVPGAASNLQLPTSLTLGVVGIECAALSRQNALHHAQRPIKHHVVAYTLGLPKRGGDADGQ